MKKLYEKEPIWFAVLWIGIYVLGFSNADSLSEAMGVPKLLTVAVGLVLALILWRFLRKNNLETAQGLCPFRGNYRRFLYFLPLIAISSVNFWFGTAVTASPLQTLLYILSMCLVGFLEEVIFRGMLFRGMCRTNVKAAIVVSSLTFGAGHIINLLLGEPLLDTLLQLIYASAIGFCYTAVFYTGGSILPCIASHIFVNTTSVFAVEAAPAGQLLIAAIETVLGVSYGIWLLYKKKVLTNSEESL
jgi:membrane protease YdiL (CAAX protease family)